MRGLKSFPFGIIDVLGGCAVAACTLGFVWVITIGSDRTRGEISELNRLIRMAQHKTRVLESAREQQHAILKSRRAELATRGQLPVKAPIEEYFRTLSVLASKHHLRVIRHQPLSPRYYPGLLEQRYAYEVAGTTLDLVRFLKAIEDADFWADVSYLRIQQEGTAAVRSRASSVNPRGLHVAAQSAALTISVFSAAPAEPDVKGGDA